MSSATKHLLTIEEFLQLPDYEHLELVRGEVVKTMPPSKEHGMIAVAIARFLSNWSQQGGVGKVGVESGFILATNPETVRGPDVYFVSTERAKSDENSGAFWTIPPDLSVEVVSPSESAEDVRDKVRDFLAAGTPLVWVVYPRTREIVAHTPDGVARTYSIDDTLEFPDVLPGFSCKVSEIFE